jgi:uncharacterized membrane protein YbhN (UPF0104 family)
MVVSDYAIHAGCAALLLVNLVVRTWRTQVIFAGLDTDVEFTDVAAANLAGDTAAALTPLRVGGLPAQIAFFQRIGIAPQRSVPTLLVESLLLYPVYAVIGGGLALVAGLEWFGLLRTFSASAGRLLLLVGGLFALGWLLMLVARRAAPNRSQQVGRSLREGLSLVRRMGWRPALLTVPLTIADVLTRIALLPLLALGVVGAPPADVLAIASFAMLYGQIAMPTPGGAGIVDLGLLGGAAGNLGPEAGEIVLWWRAYTAGLHMLLCIPALWWRLARRPRLASAGAA